MPSRRSVEEVIKGWSVGKNLTQATITELCRAVHIVASTLPRNLRSDADIAAEVATWKAAIKRTNDPVKVANVYLNDSDCIPYHAQKVVQWLVAEAYSAGLKKGQSDVN